MGSKKLIAKLTTKLGRAPTADEVAKAKAKKEKKGKRKLDDELEDENVEEENQSDIDLSDIDDEKEEDVSVSFEPFKLYKIYYFRRRMQLYQLKIFKEKLKDLQSLLKRRARIIHLSVTHFALLILVRIDSGSNQMLFK